MWAKKSLFYAQARFLFVFLVCLLLATVGAFRLLHLATLASGNPRIRVAEDSWVLHRGFMSLVRKVRIAMKTFPVPISHFLRVRNIYVNRLTTRIYSPQQTNCHIFMFFFKKKILQAWIFCSLNCLCLPVCAFAVYLSFLPWCLARVMQGSTVNFIHFFFKKKVSIKDFRIWHVSSMPQMPCYRVEAMLFSGEVVGFCESNIVFWQMTSFLASTWYHSKYTGMNKHHKAANDLPQK